MTQEVKMFTVVCDNCGKTPNEDADCSLWNDENAAKEETMNAGWINEDGKDYCTDCYSHDDENNLQIKETEKRIRYLFTYKDDKGIIQEKEVRVSKVNVDLAIAIFEKQNPNIAWRSNQLL